VLAVFDGPVVAGVDAQVAGPGQASGQAGDAEGDLLVRPRAVRGPRVAADTDDLGGVRPGDAVGGGDTDAAPLAAAVPGAFAGPGGASEIRICARQGGGHGGQQAGLVALDQEGDRLRRFRARLPCEVVVTAVTHPLHGCRLRAYAVRHVDGVPHLKVELPDGMPGLVAVEATDALGADSAGAGAGLVLDGDGLRRLRAVVMRLRDGDASGPGQ
jgi:hypothetical protein